MTTACSLCGGTELLGKDTLCRPCRIRRLVQLRTQYVFTDALREQIRQAYQLRRSKRAVVLARLVEQTGWPRHIFYQEAVRLGCVRARHERWRPEEDAWLREHAGVALQYAAMQLHRSRWSVRARIYALDLSLQANAEGYSAAELADVMGVQESRARSWMRRGLLGGMVTHNGVARVTDCSVEKFLRQHPHEYDLRLVDQVWFKAMVFGAVAA